MARNQRDSIRNRIDALTESKPWRIPTLSEAIGRALFHQQSRSIETGRMNEADWKTEAECIAQAGQFLIERGEDPDDPLYERTSAPQRSIWATIEAKNRSTDNALFPRCEPPARRCRAPERRVAQGAAGPRARAQGAAVKTARRRGRPQEGRRRGSKEGPGRSRA